MNNPFFFFDLETSGVSAETAHTTYELESLRIIPGKLIILSKST